MTVYIVDPNDCGTDFQHVFASAESAIAWVRALRNYKGAPPCYPYEVSVPEGEVCPDEPHWRFIFAVYPEEYGPGDYGPDERGYSIYAVEVQP